MILTHSVEFLTLMGVKKIQEKIKAALIYDLYLPMSIMLVQFCQLQSQVSQYVALIGIHFNTTIIIFFTVMCNDAV